MPCVLTYKRDGWPKPPKIPATPGAPQTGLSPASMYAIMRHQGGALRSNQHDSRCPECGSYVETVDVDEAVCPDCDLIIDHRPVQIERRPIYDAQDWRSKAQSGGRSTYLRSDDGLGLGVTWTLRDWERSRTSEDYRLDYAFGEIQRMASVLDISLPEQEEAGRIFRRCHEEDILVGRSLDGFATASLLAAARQHSKVPPILTSEFESVSRATPEQIRTARGAITLSLDIGIPPLSPLALAPRVASELDVKRRVRRTARDLIDGYIRGRGDHGRTLSPQTVAGAAFHAAYDLMHVDDRPALTTIAETVGTNPCTISNRKTDLLECCGETVSGQPEIPESAD